MISFLRAIPTSSFPNVRLLFTLLIYYPGWHSFVETSLFKLVSSTTGLKKKYNYHMNPNNNKIMLQAVIIHTFLEILFFNCTMFKRSGRF